MKRVLRITMLVLFMLTAVAVFGNDIPIPKIEAPVPKIVLSGYIGPSVRVERKSLHSTPFDRRIFLSGIILLGAAKSADVLTTRQLLDRGGVELNPIYGRHPSLTKQAGVNAVFFVAESAAFYITEHNRRPWVRWIGRTWLGANIANHAQLAACNAGINAKDPLAKCHSIPTVF